MSGLLRRVVGVLTLSSLSVPAGGPLEVRLLEVVDLVNYD
jgi:hypothetical protein